MGLQLKVFDELIESSIRPLYFDHDTGGGIPDIPVESVTTGKAVDVGPEPYALDNAGDRNSLTHFHATHGLYKYAVTWPCGGATARCANYPCLPPVVQESSRISIPGVNKSCICLCLPDAKGTYGSKSIFVNIRSSDLQR